MAKSKSKSKSKKSVKRGSKPLSKATPSVEPLKREDEFDLGGLPQRDLKKNLGCG
jgi:hypothetical protein